VLEVYDRALVGTELGSQLGLGETLCTAAGTDALHQSGPGWLRVVTEKPDDPAVVLREGSGKPVLPETDVLGPDAEGLGDGSLPKAAVEATLAQVVSEGLRLDRVTPWQGTRSRGFEPEGGKGQ
jgi:hypothetical protein